jgi:hypothetical protein
MTASRGRGFSGGRGSGPTDQGPQRGRGHGHGRSSHGGFSNRGGGGSSARPSRPQCQVCEKIRHTTKTCWYRYDDDGPDQRTAAMVATDDDNAWKMDSGVTNHITGDLEWLTTHDTYLGQDQIHTANRIGMTINCVGNSNIPTPCDLVLNNVLHVPSTQKNLVSVHRFTLDNDTFIEFHPFFFLIKDQKTRKVLLHGPCRGDLYPLPPSMSKFRKLMFSAVKIPVDR